MPGLLGGVARAAVAAGTMTAVSNRVSRRQANRWAQQDQAAYPPAPQYAAPPPPQPQYAAAPPAAPAAPPVDLLEQLRQLGELKESGVLTEEEFAAQKSRILAQ